MRNCGGRYQRHVLGRYIRHFRPIRIRQPQATPQTIGSFSEFALELIVGEVEDGAFQNEVAE